MVCAYMPTASEGDVVCVLQQMVGTHPLDHEVAALAIRRFHQIDVEAQSVNMYMMWNLISRLVHDHALHAFVDVKKGLRESWIRGSLDSRTISFARTVGL
ncbi:hypothetical protein VPH35_003872 [Triticum aestivum]